MATYIVSFRISDTGDYASRWRSVMEEIHAQAAGGTFWEETTALVILQSTKSAEDIASAIYFGSQFSQNSDTLLVVNAQNATFATRGKVDYPATLASLFPHNALMRALGA
jgi:hypothetical protein